MDQPQSDAIALLKADHRKVEDLFSKFEAATAPEKKHVLVKQICAELTVHAVIEQEIFYAACRGQTEEGVPNEAWVARDEASVLIAELEASRPSEKLYDATVMVLSEEIERHVREEEIRAEQMLSRARAAGIDMAQLGARMAARRRILLAEIEARDRPTRRVAGGAPRHSG